MGEEIPVTEQDLAQLVARGSALMREHETPRGTGLTSATVLQTLLDVGIAPQAAERAVHEHFAIEDATTRYDGTFESAVALYDRRDAVTKARADIFQTIKDMGLRTFLPKYWRREKALYAQAKALQEREANLTNVLAKIDCVPRVNELALVNLMAGPTIVLAKQKYEHDGQMHYICDAQPYRRHPQADDGLAQFIVERKTILLTLLPRDEAPLEAATPKRGQAVQVYFRDAPMNTPPAEWTVQLREPIIGETYAVHGFWGERDEKSVALYLDRQCTFLGPRIPLPSTAQARIAFLQPTLRRKC